MKAKRLLSLILVCIIVFSFTLYAFAANEDLRAGYKTNANGETFGNDIQAMALGYEADLILATGENGVLGYIRTSDLDNKVSDPDEAVSKQNYRIVHSLTVRYIPLYIFIISPVYAAIPSRLTALFERLTSVLYDSGVMNTDVNPLLNKNVAIFNYCSCGICDDSSIKIIFDKFVMKNYKFDRSTYSYLNTSKKPQEEYADITSYVMSTLKKLC